MPSGRGPMLRGQQAAKQTFHGDVDPRGQEETAEAVVEDLVSLQRGRRVVRDFNT